MTRCNYCHQSIIKKTHIKFCNKTCQFAYLRKRSEISRIYPYNSLEQIEALKLFAKLGKDYP